MQTPNEDPTNPYVYEMKALTKPLQHHHPSKSFKNIYRSSHYKSYKYADIGFTITKQNKKYVAHCRVCNRTLGNTAYARLKGHRNICREAPLEDNGPELYPVISNETYVTKQTDSLSQHCISQTSNDSSRLTFNVMTPKIEAVECQLSANLHPYSSSEQESQLLNEENQLKLNMIEILLPIKYNKRLLFEDNANNTKKSVDIWMNILTKAQSLGLAPTGVPWTYARDSLYSVWRLHTLQKKDAIESGEINVKYNIVDLSILQIENAPMSNEESIFENENLYETANNSMDDKIFTENINSSKNNWEIESTTTIATQTSDEMYKADLRLKLLQCESMEIENYKRSLEAFELERKLQIPRSKFAAKYFPTTQIRSNERSNGRWVAETDSMVKIELDD